MKTHRLTVVLAILFGLVVTRPATAVPVDYILFDSSILADLGSFTADPAAAAPGVSEVPMTSLTFTQTVLSQAITVTLAGLTSGAGTFQAIFFDGQLASVTGFGSGSVPGIGFTLDFTPFIPADPSLIDLSGVGAYNLTAVSDDGPFDAAIGSVGIRTATATVPEPSSAVLLGIALVASSMVRRSANAPR